MRASNASLIAASMEVGSASSTGTGAGAARERAIGAARAKVLRKRMMYDDVFRSECCCGTSDLLLLLLMILSQIATPDL